MYYITDVEVRGQMAGVDALFPPYGIGGSNSGHQLPLSSDLDPYFYTLTNNVSGGPR